MNFFYEQIVNAVININNLLPLINSKIIPFIFLLGVLVFIHELGHFLVAKYFGVRVEEFSLGFPPKLFGKKFGETEYIISLLPLGGYVKLAGQDDFGKQTVNTNDKSMYYSKPAWQRILIVFAGPFMNFVIGWILFTYIFSLGISADYNPAFPGKIGYVLPDMPAYKSGFKPEDEIMEISGKKINNWKDIQQLSILPESEKYDVKIKRQDEILNKTITPVRVGKNYYFGISPYTPPEIGTIISYKDKKNLFMPGDIIIFLDDRKINLWNSITEYIYLNPEKKIMATVLRDNKILKFEIEPEKIKSPLSGSLDIKFQESFESDYYYYTNYVKSASENLGLQNGDKIVAVIEQIEKEEKIDGIAIVKNIDGKIKDIKSGFEFFNLIMDYEGKSIKIKFERYGQTLFNIVKVGKKDIFIGVLNIQPPDYIEKHTIWKSFVKSIGETKNLILGTFTVISRIAQRKINAEDVLGGPISIWKMTVITAEAGYKHFVLLMAIISINLGFINLLPIPMIDGGHLVIYCYEIIRGKMPSEKVLNVIQHIGLIFILMLMFFTFYIDIAKMF